MRYYWFGRHMDKDLKDISDILEDAGFYGILLPYVAGLGDQIVRVARAINKEQKLKYIVAIRPHTISPQYLLMINKSMNAIDRNRLEINFVPGVIGDDEKDYGGIMGEVNDSSNGLVRRDYLAEYMSVWYNIYDEKPYSYVAGTSAEIVDMVEKYADANMIPYEYLINTKDPIHHIKRPRVVSVAVRSTDGLLDIIEHIKSLGYEDIMFHGHGDTDYPLALDVFKLIKELNA
jgi:hypothetical protein